MALWYDPAIDSSRDIDPAKIEMYTRVEKTFKTVEVASDPSYAGRTIIVANRVKPIIATETVGHQHMYAQFFNGVLLDGMNNIKK